MSCKKYYACDLCGQSIEQSTGIGVYHKSGGGMRAVYFGDQSAGHHLCNGCVEGLKAMFADLTKMGEMYDKLDAAE